mgnify:CR=1 FL=1
MLAVKETPNTKVFREKQNIRVDVIFYGPSESSERGGWGRGPALPFRIAGNSGGNCGNLGKLRKFEGGMGGGFRGDSGGGGGGF